MNHFYTGLVDNNHAHYYSTDNLNNSCFNRIKSLIRFPEGVESPAVVYCERWQTTGGPVKGTTPTSTAVPPANLPEADNNERMIQQERHLLVMQRRRSLYNNMIRHA